ncbi:LAFE_0B06832g1_1 [Lachancea fermentati]|uniref:LAFE_0B06832g1_1 n=1 Tax=Lachancea fermentati TaxID=4955 RepID=A0A1G4M813_LACFM|nr:LAFE_0B06832g1_1 [Lachancea fermentati]
MTTSRKNFYFGVLRVSMIQLLKSQGFDKAKPSTVDMLTDLYVRFLQLLALEVAKLSESRSDGDGIALQDISQAMQNLGMLKPMDLLDVYDENPDLPSDAGMQKFKTWCLSNVAPKEARIVAHPTSELLRPKDKNSKPLSMIPEYINQLNPMTTKKNGDKSSETELIEQMISNGDFDDWLVFTITRQRLNTARKISGREPKDIHNLPALPGLRYTAIYKQKAVGNNEFEPSKIESTDSDDISTTEQILISKMPVSQKENRLENISLSFEEELSDVDIENVDIDMDDADLLNTELNDDEEAFGSISNTLTLNPSSNGEFVDGDNSNAFQRRDSLNFDDVDRYRDHSFNFDEF